MRYRIYDQQGMNFLTLTIVDWIDLFTRPIYAEIVIASLRFCQKEKGLLVYAYVIMPSHIHMIVQATSPTGLSSILQSFKSFTAKQFLNAIKAKTTGESRREWLLNRFAFQAQKNNINSNYQIWQKGNHPIELCSPKVIRQKLNYIHVNPMREKIVAQPAHYIWSSASNYETGEGVLDVQIMDDIWNDKGYNNYK